MWHRGARQLLILLVIVFAGWAQSAAAASYANLADVSCGSPGNCAAVGTAYAGSTSASAVLYTQALRVWSRGTAAALPADAEAGSLSYLFSVACPSAGNCVAAGEYTNSAGGFAGLLASQTNGTWTTGVAAQPPAGAAAGPRQSVELGSVTCVSAGNCTVVGGYMDGGGSGRPLILTETGGTWAGGVQGALPANASTRAGHQFARLSSVSCPSAGNCTAVGTYADSTGKTRGLLLTETAGVWAGGVEARLPGDAGADALMNPSAHFNYGLNQVSCRAVGECTVVGEYANNAGIEQGLLLTEHKGSWSRGVQPRLPANAATERFKRAYVLWSESCTSAGNCTVVGWYADRSGRGDPLVVTERNGRWTRGVAPAPPANAARKSPIAELEWVSCASPGNCTAVGGYYAHGKLDGLLITESHGRWGRATAAALPAGGTQAASAVSDEDPALYRVSCAAAGSCSAIGTYQTGPNHPQGMLLTQTAGIWARGVQAVP